MATYIQLLTLTPEGRKKALEDPESMRRAQDEVGVADVQVLGSYAVLGDFDYVLFVEAPNNETIARYSMELGVLAGAHITTLPVIPIGRMEAVRRRDPSELETGIRPPPTE